MHAVTFVVSSCSFRITQHIALHSPVFSKHLVTFVTLYCITSQQTFAPTSDQQRMKAAVLPSTVICCVLYLCHLAISGCYNRRRRRMITRMSIRHCCKIAGQQRTALYPCPSCVRAEVRDHVSTSTHTARCSHGSMRSTRLRSTMATTENTHLSSQHSLAVLLVVSSKQARD